MSFTARVENIVLPRDTYCAYACTCDCSTRKFEVFQYYSKASYLHEG